jgi:Uma2 family endonuclease
MRKVFKELEAQIGCRRMKWQDGAGRARLVPHRVAVRQLDRAGIAESASASQSAEVVIERSVLLHQEDDVLDVRDGARAMVGRDRERSFDACGEGGGDYAAFTVVFSFAYNTPVNAQGTPVSRPASSAASPGQHARVSVRPVARPAPIATMTYAQYLALEASSPDKHEFVRGEVFAMAGGTPEHAALEAAIARVLANALEVGGKPCRVYSANLRVRVETTDFACYPDATVVCGKLETSRVDPDAATNPVVVVEVLSDSTESYDRGIKAGHYRHIPHLREYVLVAQHTPLVEVWRKNERAQWEVAAAAGRGESATIESLGIEIAVDGVYRNPAA